MITTELLDKNETLNGLTEEQKTAIVELSKHDEDIVISERVGKIYGDLDNDILTASGIAKNGVEKTYAYAKRVIGALKEQGAQTGELQAQVKTLQEEKASLEKAIAEGAADSETKRQLAQAKTDLENITKMYTDLNTQYEGVKEAHEKELFGMRVDMELESAVSGLKFKSSIPESVTKVVLADVRERIKKSATIKEEEGGQKSIVYTGADGKTMLDNSLKPLTAAEILHTELEKLGVIDKRKVQTGAGSKQQTDGEPTGIDLTGAKTQVEADELIHKSLVSRGLVIGTSAYQDARDKAWKDNAITKLPIK